MPEVVFIYHSVVLFCNLNQHLSIIRGESPETLHPKENTQVLGLERCLRG